MSDFKLQMESEIYGNLQAVLISNCSVLKHGASDRESNALSKECSQI